MDLGEAYCLSGTYAEGRGDGYRSWLRLSPDAAFQSPCAEFVCVSGDSLLGTVEEETPWETRVRQPQRQQTQPSPAPWSAKDLLKDCSPLTQWGASQVAIPRVSACVYSDRGLACGMGVQLSVDTFVVVLEVDQNIRSAKVQLTKRTHGPGRDFEEGWVSLDDIRLDAKNDCPLTPSYFEEEPLEQWLQLLRGSQVVIPTYCCFRLRQREGESPKAHDLRMKTSGCDIVVVTPPRLVDSTSTLTERGKAPQTDSAATWKVATDSGEKVMHWTDLKQWAQGHGVILEQYDSYARYHLAGIRHEHGLRAESFKGMFGDVTPYYRYNNTKHMRWVEWLCDRIQSIASLDPSLASGTRRRLSACTAFADAAEVLEGTQWGVALSSASCLLSTLQTSSPRNDPLAAERPNGWFYMRSLRMDLAGGLPGRHMGVYRHDSTAFPLDLRASPSVTSTDTLSLRNGACFEVYGTYVSVCGREAYAYVRVTGGPASPVGCTRLVDAAGASGWVSLRSEKHISLNNEPRICWRRARLAKTEGAMSPESACLSLIGITRSLFK